MSKPTTKDAINAAIKQIEGLKFKPSYAVLFFNSIKEKKKFIKKLKSKP